MEEEILQVILRNPSLIVQAVRTLADDYGYSDNRPYTYEGIPVSEEAYDLFISMEGRLEEALLDCDATKYKDKISKLECEIDTLKSKLKKKDDAFKRLKAKHQEILLDLE